MKKLINYFKFTIITFPWRTIKAIRMIFIKLYRIFVFKFVYTLMEIQEAYEIESTFKGFAVLYTCAKIWQMFRQKQILCRQIGFCLIHITFKSHTYLKKCLSAVLFLLLPLHKQLSKWFFFKLHKVYFSMFLLEYNVLSEIRFLLQKVSTGNMY